MDITTVLGVICSVAVFAAWFVLPGKVEAPPAVSLPETGLANIAA
jgi:hypothetical protein